MYSLLYDNDRLCLKTRRGNILRLILEWLMMMTADHVSAVCRSGYYQLRQLRCVV